MNIRTYYLETYLGLFRELVAARDIYKFIGVSDSLVRERLFDKLAKLLNEPYEYIYNLWLNS
jgi:hypothetical protein